MRPRGIPAENRESSEPPTLPHPRFNEAAGNTRGKPQGPEYRTREARSASMRPRGIPAENPRPSQWPTTGPTRFNEAAGNTRGKPRGTSACGRQVRPGFNEAAGNTRGKRGYPPPDRSPARPASMRPRGIPAENVQVKRKMKECPECASMRPRGIPAENGRSCTAPARPRSCFNEAAGNTRGKPRIRARAGGGNSASMRPRGIPAENLGESPCYALAMTLQ